MDYDMLGKRSLSGDDDDDDDYDDRRETSESPQRYESSEKAKNEKYCFCNDGKGFMIGCDACFKWYHGECVGITSKDSRKIVEYYCPFCCEKDPSLMSKLKEARQTKKSIKSSEANRGERRARDGDEEDDEDDVMMPFADHNRRSGKADDYSADEHEYEEDDDDDDDDEDDDDDDDDEFQIRSGNQTRSDGGTKRRYRKRTKDHGARKSSNQKERKNNRDRCGGGGGGLSSKKSSSSQSGNKSQSKQGKVKKGKAGRPKKDEDRGGGGGKSHRRRGGRKDKEKEKAKGERALNYDTDDELQCDTIVRQCHGPRCVYAARRGSKYCSEQCGERLALNRILALLPARIEQQQRIPSQANQTLKRESDTLKYELDRSACILAEIKRQKESFGKRMRIAKMQIPYTEEESNEIVDNEADNDYTMHCQSCSQDISLKNSLKHMERCFNKLENQTSYSSLVKWDAEHVFCNFHHKKQGTYCRRLKILCVEHNKETRIDDDEVCGCPLRSEHDDPFGEIPDAYCRLLRKKCIRHYGWERAREAVFDMHIIQQVCKFEELQDRHAKSIARSQNRNGLCSLLLHQTIYHAPE